MFKVQLRNENYQYIDLMDLVNYVVKDIRGLDFPEATVSTQSNRADDGMQITNSRIESRQIEVDVKLLNKIEKSRQNIYKLLPPQKSVRFYYTNANRNVYIDGVVKNIDCEIFTEDEIATIIILCPSPTFNDVKTQSTSFSTEIGYFTLPFAIPKAGVPFGALSRLDRTNVVSEGESTTGMTIYCYASGGAVVNPSLVNVGTSERLTVGVELDTNDTLVIVTNKGSKSITWYHHGEAIDALSYINYDSDWLQLEPGDNIFACTADEGASNLTIIIKNTINYYGV